MPIHVKKNKGYSRGLLVLAVLLTLQAALAQDDAADPGVGKNGTPASPTPKAVPGTNATEIDSSTSTALDYLFNHKASEGTTMKAGNEVASALADKIKAVDVLKTPGLDNPVVRARFETYLSLKEVPDARIKEYFGKMAQVSETLKAGNNFGAWKLLYALSEYKDLDAGISRELANRVESIWNSGRTQNGLQIANDNLRGNIETYNHNADLIAEDLHYQEQQEQQKTNNNKASAQANNNSQNSGATNSPLTSPNADPVAAEAAIMPTMASSLQGKMELTSEYLKLLEARAKIRLNEIRADKMSDQDREDFADYIRTLYNTHRYYHVIMAADFYRAIFNEGDYPKDVMNQASASASSGAKGAANTANQAMTSMGVNGSKLVNGLTQAGTSLGMGQLEEAAPNTPMSIADEVTSALEINNRVSQSIEVFKYKTDKGEVAAAAEQLQEAFVGNEFHPGLQGLPRTDKEKVGTFLTKLDVLKNQLEVRDFEQVEGQIGDIKKIASDFDSTKPLALVNGIKLESRLRLGKAKLLAQGGRLSDAMLEFQTAAEEWPGNPDLQTSASTFFNSEDLQNQSTVEFDRLVKDQNYRAIFDKQVIFATAIKGDATRLQQFKDALDKVQKAEIAAQKANMLVMNGDADGAWETIELAAKDWPDDMKLNKLLANLSGRSADFVSALNKAREAESKQELGYSLTWFVNAQGYYPASVIANEGIDRISKQILSPRPATSSAGMN